MATEGGVAGDPISDTATLIGAHLPTTGTVTFNLYGRLDPNCTGTAIFTSTVRDRRRRHGDLGLVHGHRGGQLSLDRLVQRRCHNDAVAGSCGDDGETTVYPDLQP